MRAWILITVLPAVGCIELPDLSVRASWKEIADAGLQLPRTPRKDADETPDITIPRGLDASTGDTDADASAAEPPPVLQTITQEISESGGVVELATGARVEFPVAALRGAVQVSLSELDRRRLPRLPVEVVPIGVPHAVTPYGTPLDEPAVVNVPNESTVNPVAIYRLDSPSDTTWEHRLAKRNERTLETKSASFGIFVPVKLLLNRCGPYPLCHDECTDTTSDVLHCGGCDHTCGAKEICVKSTCQTKLPRAPDAGTKPPADGGAKKPDAGGKVPSDAGNSREPSDAGASEPPADATMEGNETSP